VAASAEPGERVVPNRTEIEIVQGDITKQKVDAIVNAANSTLRGGGGVDGAIHRAAGSGLLEECALVGGCPTGEARLTRGYELPARHVIHAVGPIWQGGGKGEADLLESAYRSSLDLAERHGIRTIAFPAISCGIYRFPVEKAAQIAVKTVRAHVAAGTKLEKILLVCFEDEVLKAYRKALEGGDRPDPPAKRGRRGKPGAARSGSGKKGRGTREGRRWRK
jgi:O-acetyl-ADP-ribose deacetylase (regulator of RNase III)